MKKTFLSALVLAACSMQGALITFTQNIDLPAGNVISLFDSSLPNPALAGALKATAWTIGTSTTTPTIPNGTIVQSRLRNYGTAGLGVCNPQELLNTSVAGTTCDATGSPTEHQVDNLTGYDLVMFQFTTSTAVNAPKQLATNITFQLGNLAKDWDVSYWLGNTNGNVNTALLNGKTTADLASLGFQSRVDLSTSASVLVNSGGLVNLNIGNTIGYNTIIFGTRFGESDDGFKIRSIGWTPTGGGTGVVETVPEPGTYAMLGAGLFALGYWRRKSA